VQKKASFIPASINLALLCRRQGRTADALEVLDAALRTAPGDSRVRRLLARTLTQERRFEEAETCLASIADPPDAEICALRGGIALGRGDLDEAIAQLTQSLGFETTEEAAMNLSTALEARGDRQGALQAVAEALRVVPTSAAALQRFAALSRNVVGATPASPANDRFTIFFYQPHSIPFDGTTPRTRGLGGTESAIVYLAEGLNRLGHRCVVFNTCEPATVEGVEYARWETMPARSVADRPDVVVSVRHWQVLGQVRFAPLQIFWTGDAFDQPFLASFGDPARRAEIDLVMLQSDWQEDTFHAHHGVPRSQIVRTRLGAAQGVRPHESTRVMGSDPRPRRLAYASTPFRGLDVLLDLFPRIRAKVPDAELEVFSSMRVYGMSAEEDQNRFEALYRKADQPGVTLVGTVPQFELAERLQQARVLAYPNHYAETFCIAAAEAQAAGCAVVTTSLGALPETVGQGGICIPGDPRTPAYQQTFVDACVALLTDDRQWQDVSDKARAHASEKYSWASIAEGWERVCRAGLAVEPPDIDRIAVHLAAGRAGLAERMLARATRPDDVPADAWSALRAFTAWRAGTQKETPPRDVLSRVALSFRTLRRSGVLDAAA
jgi:tetratricopeptide (TPR) repeat protein